MKPNTRFVATLALLATLAGSGTALAAGSTPLTVKPVLLDGHNGSGATLALDYKLEYQRSSSGAGDDTGRDTFSFDKVGLWDRVLEVRGQGTLAVSSERNPNKLLDLALHTRYDRLGDGWRAGLGFQFKAETDQSFDDRQFAWGLQLRSSYNNPFDLNGWAIAYLNLARIQPNSDKARAAALMTQDLDGFRRWDAEIIWHKDLGLKLGKLDIRALEVQYRHYQEVSAPAAIRAAHLDRHRLGTVRLNIDGDKFIAYSRGSLPFDRKSDRAIKVGWTYEF
jgi:hypothetical protein